MGEELILMASKNNKRRGRNKLSAEARAFVNGRTDKVTIEAPKTRLGFSPAQAQSNMCHQPGKRDLSRASRRGRGAAIDASRNGN